MSKIHPTAVVEDGAELAADVVVGAHAYIGSEVKIGAGTVVHHHATVDGFTEMGEGNEVFPYAFVGGKTQDLKYVGGTTGLRIGNENTFREFSTVHRATQDGDFTIIGSHNHFLSYTHIAHDCQVGDHIIMSNNGTLAGHVIVEDHVVLGGLSAVHQFCRLGAHSMLGGMCKIVQDVPPFMIADGNPAEVRSINKVGLERRGFDKEAIELVREIYKTLYRAGLNRSQAIARLKEHAKAEHLVIQAILAFADKSQRGFV